MFSESLFCVRSHLRCHVDFQAVKKTQPGPLAPMVKQVRGSFREKDHYYITHTFFSLESYNHPKCSFQELMDEVKLMDKVQSSRSFSARRRGVIWDDEV